LTTNFDTQKGTMMNHSMPNHVLGPTDEPENSIADDARGIMQGLELMLRVGAPTVQQYGPLFYEDYAEAE
jgi:hypothetical protein